MLVENGYPTGMGRDMWILSHLTYPVVWVLEIFQIHKVGRERDAEELDGAWTTPTKCSLVASYVDMNLWKNKLIIFIIPTKTRSTVEVGGAVFDIY